MNQTTHSLMEVFKAQTLANLVKQSIATITRHVSHNGFVMKIVFILSTYNERHINQETISFFMLMDKNEMF